jgi:hypothetical protein
MCLFLISQEDGPHKLVLTGSRGTQYSRQITVSFPDTLSFCCCSFLPTKTLLFLHCQITIHRKKSRPSAKNHSKMNHNNIDWLNNSNGPTFKKTIMMIRGACDDESGIFLPAWAKMIVSKQVVALTDDTIAPSSAGPQ